MRFPRSAMVLLLSVGMVASSCRQTPASTVQSKDQGKIIGCAVANAWWLLLGFGAGLPIALTGTVALGAVLGASTLSNSVCAPIQARRATVKDVGQISRKLIRDAALDNELASLQGSAEKMDQYDAGLHTVPFLRDLLADLQLSQLRFENRGLQAVSAWSLALQMRFVVTREIIRRGNLDQAPAASSDTVNAIDMLKGRGTTSALESGVAPRIAALRELIRTEASESRLFPDKPTVSGGRDPKNYYCKHPTPLTEAEQAYVNHFEDTTIDGTKLATYKTEEWSVLQARIDFIKEGVVCSEFDFTLRPLVEARVAAVQKVLSDRLIDQNPVVQNLVNNYQKAIDELSDLNPAGSFEEAPKGDETTAAGNGESHESGAAL